MNQRKKFFYRGFLSVLGVSIVSAIWVGCGKPSAEDGSELIPINLGGSGKARFQSYCLDDAGGTPVYERPIEMYCREDVSEVTLLDSLPLLNLYGDCEKGTLTIRPEPSSGLKETLWQLPVRNANNVIEFDLEEIPYGSIRLRGGGNGECTSSLQLNLYGSMTCTGRPEDRYKPVLDVKAIYWLNKSVAITTTTVTTTTTTTSPTMPFPWPTFTSRPTAQVRPSVLRMDNNLTGGCSLPTSCYLFTNTVMKQCQ